MSTTTGQFWGAVLLTAGTAIGAGMLALPLTTGIGGFMNASSLIVACFLFMLVSVFLLFEAMLYRDENINLFTLTKDFLGLPGAALAWFCFVGLLYAVSAAYISGGGIIITTIMDHWQHITHHKGALIFTIFFGSLAYLGVHWTDYINRVLMVGLIAAYLYLILAMAPQVHWHNLNGGQPIYLWATIPVVLLSFTSHIILPSLRSYLKNDIQVLKKVLIFGSLIPLACYLTWEFLVVGLLAPVGPNSIATIAKTAHPLHSLIQVLNLKGIHGLALGNTAFSFFALVTSFLGVMLSLKDFLSNEMPLDKIKHERCAVLLLTITPPALIVFFFPSFVHLLSYAGVLVAILYIIIPSLIVWKARYTEKLPTPDFHFPGGKASLIAMMLAGVTVIGIQIAVVQQWLPTP